jgi:hypothetical protein
MTDTHRKNQPESPPTSLADPVQLVRDTLEKLCFGAIQLTVHEGKLVQMDVTEKRRFVA